MVALDRAFPGSPARGIDFSRNPVEIGLDVRDRSGVLAAVETVAQRCGRIDVAVNAAGVLSVAPVLEIDESGWDEVMDVNLKGTFLICQAVMRQMQKQRKGAIVNVASISGQSGGALAGADYSASKAGVLCLTKSLAAAGAPYGVRVNAVAPGMVNTAMPEPYYRLYPEAMEEYRRRHPLGRWAEPSEIAFPIVFLASDGASYITGACLNVNGGSLMI